MPSKKPNKAAKKPGKAIPKKAAKKSSRCQKGGATARQPQAHVRHIEGNSETRINHRPSRWRQSLPPPTRRAGTPAPAKAEPKPDNLKTAAEKHGPIKFDSRPLVIPLRAAQIDDDGDAEQGASASLLAGPRNVKPYIARRGEQYMSKEQLEHFARILQNWKRDLMVEVDRTVLHMKDEAANFPDPNDRATQEEEFSLELRTRDRERKLIRKIDEALKRIEDGSYGYCLETGEEIGIKRLEARPVATLSVEAQERRERREKQYGDRDDRYR